jgi:hypothetical protein
MLLDKFEPALLRFLQFLTHQVEGEFPRQQSFLASAHRRQRGLAGLGLPASELERAAEKLPLVPSADGCP